MDQYPPAKRKRRSIQKKRNELGEEGYLGQQAQKQREWRINRDLNPAQREQQKRKERATKRKQRADKKLMENAEKKRTSKSTLYRSVSRVSKVLPNTPRLKGSVIIIKI